MKRRGENSGLSPRESQLFAQLIGSSDDLANIAYRIGITHGTAKVYSVRVYRKLDVTGRVDLMSREIARLKGRE